MRRRVYLILILLLQLTLLNGCLPIPHNVQNVDYGKYMVPLSELSLSENRIELQINDSYAIDTTINMQFLNPNIISEYEVRSKCFTEEAIRHILNDYSNWEVLDGALLSSGDLNEDTYIPFICKSNYYSIYVNEKRGILTCASKSYAASDLSNIVDISQVDNKDFNDACKLANGFIERIDCELIPTFSEAYCNDGTYYWCFDYAQAIDGIRIVQDAVGVKNENAPYLPEVEIIIKDKELYFFSAVLMEKINSINDYENVISLDGAIQIISDKSNLLFKTGRNYMRSNGQVVENGLIIAKEIYIAYYPLKLDKSVSKNKLVPIWFFWSGDNIDTDAYLNIKVNAITGEIL